MAYAYLCEQLHTLRKQRGLTQEQVAKALGIDRSSYTYYELGRTEPSVESLLKISKLFGVSVDVLLEQDSSEKQPILMDTPLRSKETVAELTAKALTDPELEWLYFFRKMDNDQKAAWLNVLNCSIK